MSEIPAAISAKLTLPTYGRVDEQCVDEVIRDLGVTVRGVFEEFYRKYQGPFFSNVTGFELLDLCDQVPNIKSQTETCRSVYHFPAKFLVLTDLVGIAALVYDSQRDEVFNVDFEGGESELVDGTLKPEWISFALFLNEYFS